MSIKCNIAICSAPLTGAMSAGLGAQLGRFSLIFFMCVIKVVISLPSSLPLVPLPRGSMWVRIFPWCVGLFGWFAGSVLSTMAANS
jgi:hypothetical protein